MLPTTQYQDGKQFCFAWFREVNERTEKEGEYEEKGDIFWFSERKW